MLYMENLASLQDMTMLITSLMSLSESVLLKKLLG